MMRNIYVSVIVIFFISTGLHAADVTKVKGSNALIDLKGEPAAPGDTYFTIGTDNQVRAEDFDATGHTSGGYFLVATGTVQAIKAGRDASGQPLLLAIKADGQVEMISPAEERCAFGAVCVVVNVLPSVASVIDSTKSLAEAL